MERLGNLIKNRRKELGLSLRDFARRCGMSHSYIKNLESGDPRSGKPILPTFPTLKKLACVFDMPLEEFLLKIGYIYNHYIDADCYTFIEDSEITGFISNPDNIDYVRLAKEMRDHGVDIGIVRENITKFRSGK